MADAESLVAQPLPARRKRAGPHRRDAGLLPHAARHGQPAPARRGRPRRRPRPGRSPAAAPPPRPPPPPGAAPAPRAPPTPPAAPAAARRPARAAPPNPQDWLASIFYPQTAHRRHVPDRCRRPARSPPCPRPPAATSGPASSTPPLEGCRRADPDAAFRTSRPSTRAPPTAGWSPAWSSPCATRAGTLLGFLGADILVERLGRRLRGVEMAPAARPASRSSTSNGRPLFIAELPAQPARPGDGIDPSAAARSCASTRPARREEAAAGSTSSPASSRPDWTLLLERPAGAGPRSPCSDLLRRDVPARRAGWWSGTAFAAIC